jgi:hypothetical protein
MEQPENGSSPPLLQKWQQNDIISAIKVAGIDPTGFDLDNTSTLFLMKHKKSGSYITISRNGASYAGDRVVGDGYKMPYTAGSWATVASRAEVWAQEVKRDLDTPDLWAELQRDAKFLEAVSAGGADNVPFTPQEQEQIAARLKVLANDLGKKFSLTGNQVKALNGKFDELIEDTRRLGRKDWLNALIAVLLTHALNVALPTESVRAFAVTALHAIGRLYPELPFDPAGLMR